MITTGVFTKIRKNEIIVFSDKYNNDKVYQKEIDEKLIQSLKRN